MFVAQFKGKYNKQCYFLCVNRSQQRAQNISQAVRIKFLSNKLTRALLHIKEMLKSTEWCQRTGINIDSDNNLATIFEARLIHFEF